MYPIPSPYIEARNRYLRKVKYFRRQRAVGIFTSLVVVVGFLLTGNLAMLFVLPFPVLMIFSKSPILTELSKKRW